MSSLRAWCLRVTNLFGKERRDRELAEELESHLQMHIEDNIRTGMNPAEARRTALVKLGGIEQTKEKYRATRGLPFLESLMHDFRFGLRVLRNHLRNPGFLSVCIIALALGFGVSTAMFSVLYSVVLKPFPFADQNRLVVGWKADPHREAGLVELSYLDYTDWRDQAKSFEDIAAMPTTTSGYSYIMTGRGEPQQIESSRVTANYFSVLGVTPLWGRAFRPEDDRVGANPVVMLTYNFWQKRLGSDANIVGSGIELSGVLFTIIGVLPPQVTFPQGIDVFTPLATNKAWVENRRAVFLQVVGRLKPGVSLRAATAELDTIVARLAAQYPETKSDGQLATIQSLPAFITGTNKTLIYLLFAGSFILLLISSVNLASLLATKAISRSHEIGIRLALGARKKHLFKIFLIEGLILAAIGTTAGIGVAVLIVRGIVRMAPREIPRIALVSVNGWVLLFTFACMLVITLVFALTPLLLVRQPKLQDVLKDGTGAATASAESHRARRLFLLLEISATLALVVLAGTVGQSFRNLQNVKLGYDADRVFTCAIFLNPSRYPDVGARRRFFEELIDRLKDRPEITAAGAVLLRPLEGAVGWYTDYTLPGQTPDDARKNPRLNYDVVNPSYFEAIGTPLLAGRPFEESEDDTKPFVAIVSESTARLMYGTPTDALGKRFRMTGKQDLTIVGIVGDARYRQLSRFSGDIFVPYKQASQPLRYVVVRTTEKPEAMGTIVRHELSRIDPSEADGAEMTMRELVDGALARDRFDSQMLVLFSVCALLLAAVGVYGVISDLFVTRRKELGIRMALGAQPATVSRLVLRSILTWVLLGEAIGIAIAIITTWTARAALFEVSPANLTSIFSGTLVLVIVSLIACVSVVTKLVTLDPVWALKE
jgi:predicted permease